MSVGDGTRNGGRDRGLVRCETVLVGSGKGVSGRAVQAKQTFVRFSREFIVGLGKGGEVNVGHGHPYRYLDMAMGVGKYCNCYTTTQ